MTVRTLLSGTVIALLLFSMIHAAEEDRAALIALYNSTDGDNWHDNPGWKDAPTLMDGFNEDPCNPPLWFGVICDQGRPAILRLDGNGLRGTIPAELGNLTNLQEIELANNPLSGPIPADLDRLLNLTVLVVAATRLNGAIPPELGNLLNLQQLTLGSNRLTGPIPPELGNLSSLQELDLAGNQLTGVIPPELGNLASLGGLALGVNQLTGTIPPELGNLANLEVLYLARNRLTGSIPAQLLNLTKLQNFFVDGNQLTGTIPPELGNLSDLLYLGMGNNVLTGAVPPELGNLANLQLLDLRFNQLTGPIPPELGNLAHLRVLNLSNNQLVGTLPDQLGNLSALTVLRLQNNELTGVIPQSLGNLTDLQALGLFNNRLSGSIPAELGQLANILVLGLGGNKLTGEVPSEITFLSEGVLDIRNNRLSYVESGLEAELNRAQAGEGTWRSLQNVAAVYPQLAVGGGFEVVLLISSRSTSPWTGRVYLNGENWPEDRPWQLDGQDMTGQSSFAFTLEPQATRRIVLSSSSEIGLDGWVSVCAEGDSFPEDVAAAFFYNLSGESGLSDSTGVGPAKFGNAFSFPVEQSSTQATVLTGMALRSVAWGSPLYLELYDEQGTFLGVVTVSEDAAELVNDLFSFAELPADFVGSVHVESERPFYLTVLRVEVTEASGIQLTSVPATPVR